MYSGVLTNEEVIRYSRQMIIPSINPNGQVLLKNSKVLIIGVGGLGCPASLYLASAGVGQVIFYLIYFIKQLDAETKVIY